MELHPVGAIWEQSVVVSHFHSVMSLCDLKFQQCASLWQPHGLCVIMSCSSFPSSINIESVAFIQINSAV